MKAPTIQIQGRMEDRAKASRQFLENAKVKPAKNAERKVTATGTFSDMPRWTKSGNVQHLLSIPRCRIEKKKEPHTGICLYAGSDLTRTNVIKKGDFLAENSPKVSLTNTLSGHLGGVDPGRHVNVGTDKRGNACIGRGVDQSYSR